MLLLTDGRYGNPEWNEEKTIEVRKNEFESAMRQIPVKKFICLNKTDGRFCRKDIEEADLEFENYQYIFVPNRYENHPDHIEAYRAVQMLKRKRRIKGLIVQYEVWSTIRNPNCYVAFDHFSDKSFLIQNYSCQLKHIDYIGRIEGLNRYRGVMTQSAYAEAYYMEPYWRQQVSYLFFSWIVRIKKKIFG